MMAMEDDRMSAYSFPLLVLLIGFYIINLYLNILHSYNSLLADFITHF